MDFEAFLRNGAEYMREQRLQQLARTYNRLYVDKKKNHLTMHVDGTKDLKHCILSDIITQFNESTSMASLTLWDFRSRVAKDELEAVHQEYKRHMGNIAMDVYSFTGAKDPIVRLHQFAEHNALPHFHALDVGSYIYPENPWRDSIGQSVYSRESIRQDPTLERLYQFVNWCDEDHKRF